MDIKACLASGYPIVLGIKLFESFESEKVAAHGIVPLPTHGEKFLGGHAVVLVGYNDQYSKWILRNSWGPNWGDHGYFYLDYSYLTDQSLGLCSDLWVVTKVSKAPVPFHPTPIKPHRKRQHHSHHHRS